MCKFRKFLVAVIGIVMVAGCVAGCGKEAKVDGTTADILDDIDEDQLAGNVDWVAAVLHNEPFNVSEDESADKADQFVHYVFEQVGSSSYNAVGPAMDGKNIVVQDESNVLWLVTVEGSGDDIEFTDVQEADDSEYVAKGLMPEYTDSDGGTYVDPDDVNPEEYGIGSGVNESGE